MKLHKSTSPYNVYCALIHNKEHSQCLRPIFAHYIFTDRAGM
nr:MAG TPA_asm: hypothetical protein [Caudoviricetes sp.]